MSRRVVCAGGAVADLKLHLAAPGLLGTSNPATVSTSFGGVARNVAENLAVLMDGLPAGQPVTLELVSAVGDDEPGRALLDHLRLCGVGSRFVRVVPGAATAQYVAVLEPGGDLTIAAAAMDVLDDLDIDDLDGAWPGDGWLFCDTNLAPKVLTHLIERANREGTSLAVDAVSARKVVRLPADLTGITLLSCNQDEGRAWLSSHGLGTGEQAGDVQLAEALQRAGARSVMLTRGAGGLVLATPGGAELIPAQAAVPVDVTGAGDALIAGTLAALITGAELGTAVRAGMLRAARTVESSLSVLPP